VAIHQGKAADAVARRGKKSFRARMGVRCPGVLAVDGPAGSFAAKDRLVGRPMLQDRSRVGSFDLIGETCAVQGQQGVMRRVGRAAQRIGREHHSIAKVDCPRTAAKTQTSVSAPVITSVSAWRVRNTRNNPGSTKGE